MSIYVRNGIENNYTTFSLIEPVLITVSGSNNTITDYNLDFSRNTVSITVTQVVFQIHYNTTTIQTITISNPTNASTTNKLSVMYLNTSKSGSNPFSASIFIGNLELNDVVLYTPPNIIYDINILATVELDTGSQDYDVDAYFSNITYTAIYNTTSQVNTINNCVANTTTQNMNVSWYSINILAENGESVVFNGYFSVDNTTRTVAGFYETINGSTNFQNSILGPNTFPPPLDDYTADNIYINNNWGTNNGTNISSITLQLAYNTDTPYFNLYSYYFSKILWRENDLTSNITTTLISDPT
jgi:hypothetical protein